MYARLLLLLTLAPLVGCSIKQPPSPPAAPFPLKTVWQVPLDPDKESAESDDFAGPISTDGEAVFVSTKKGLLRSLDVATGELRWEKRFSPGVPLAIGGAVFLRRTAGGIDAIDAKTGDRLWQTTTGSPGDVALSVDGDRIAVVGRGVTLLDRRNGEKLWTTRGLGLFTTPALIAGGRLVAGNREGTLHCLDLATGRVIWSHAAGAPLHAAPVVDSDGRLFIGTGDGRALALSLRTGKRLWQWRTGTETAFGALCYKDLVVLVPHTAVVMAFERGSGHLDWRIPFQSRPLAPPMLVGDTLLVVGYGSRDNHMTLLAADMPSGRRLGLIGVDIEPDSAPIFANGRLLVAARSRAVVALELAKPEAAGRGAARRRRARVYEDLDPEPTPTPTPSRR